MEDMTNSPQPTGRTRPCVREELPGSYSTPIRRVQCSRVPRSRQPLPITGLPSDGMFLLTVVSGS